MEQQAAALAALGTSADTAALRARLAGPLLLSDMAAFKAANPGCCMEDFIRWHSPKCVHNCTVARVSFSVPLSPRHYSYV